VERLIIVVILAGAALAALLGGFALATDVDDLKDPASVSYGWQQSDLLPDLSSWAAAHIEMRLDTPPFNYFEPTQITDDGDGHILLIWDLGDKGYGPGWLVPATRMVFLADRVKFAAEDAPPRDAIDWGQQYHVELLIGSDGESRVQLATAEFKVRPCETSSSGWCRVYPQAGQPQPGIDIPQCPTGTRLVKPCNGCPLGCE
jgi:hypothetical protein